MKDIKNSDFDIEGIPGLSTFKWGIWAEKASEIVCQSEKQKPRRVVGKVVTKCCAGDSPLESLSLTRKWSPADIKNPVFSYELGIPKAAEHHHDPPSL
jgi:hypothetical protein